MKLLVVGLGALGLTVLALPLLVFVTVATHPWLAVGALTAPIEVVAQPTPTPDGSPLIAAPAPTVASSGLFPNPAAVIADAMRWVDARVPYYWGGCTTRGVDCSCFVHNVLLDFGINTPRVTVDQKRWATPVNRDQLEVGDIVFFDNTCRDCGPNPTHEGLYVGGGMMIEAGDPVQLAPVFTGYYGAHFAGAGRPHR